VNGEPGSIFGQVSFCNGINFFNAALALEREGKLNVPYQPRLQELRLHEPPSTGWCGD
jgi:hypothetical protein